MEVPFSPEQEATLSQIARHNGIDTAQLVKNAALRLVQEDEGHLADLEEAIQQADRGQLIDHAEVKDRIARLLKSR